MKISELIEELEEIKTTFGDLSVTVYTDHGQTESSCHGPTISYIDDDGEPVGEDEGGIKICSIYGE